MRFLLIADFNEVVSRQHCSGFALAKIQICSLTNETAEKDEGSAYRTSAIWRWIPSQHNSLTSPKFCLFPSFPVPSSSVCLPLCVCQPIKTSFCHVWLKLSPSGRNLQTCPQTNILSNCLAGPLDTL